MINFKELKNKIIMKNGKKYFSDPDVNWFNSDTSQITSLENKVNDFVFICDNRLFDYSEKYKRDFDLKVYDIDSRTIQTLYTNTDKDIVLALLDKMQNLRSLTPEEKEIFMTSTINFLGNSVQAYSMQYKYNFNFDL